MSDFSVNQRYAVFCLAINELMNYTDTIESRLMSHVRQSHSSLNLWAKLRQFIYILITEVDRTESLFQIGRLYEG